MSSISASEYREACASYIEDALRRPGMYFHTLRDLELLLRGHGMAFHQLGVDESFNTAFTVWLFDTRGVSGAAGWAIAVEQLASGGDEDAVTLFEQLIREFLPLWIPAT